MVLAALCLTACSGESNAPLADQRKTQVSAAGLVEPAGEERVLIPELGGRLKRVTFAEGDAVKAGQVLAEIENADYMAMVVAAQAEVDARAAELAKLRAGPRDEERAQARAALDEAKVATRLAANEWKRRRQLLNRQQLGREAFEQARAAFDAATARQAVAAAQHRLMIAGTRAEDLAIAQAGFTAAQAQLTRAKAIYEKTLIRAPIDGIVLKRDLREGETVVALSPVPLARIGDLSQRFVRADVDELDLGRVRPGQRASIHSDSFPERTFAGEVVYVAQRMGRRRAVSDSPTERVDNRILEVLIRLDPGSELPIGLRVDVTIDAANL